MNRTRMLMMIVVAVALSVLVTLVAYRVLNRRLNVGGTQRVVVADEELSVGTRLVEGHLKISSWPADAPIQGSFSDPKELVGRGVIIPITHNEPVLESKLAPREAGAGLTAAIPEGMRAVAVKVNDVIGVAGFVVPGTRVDLILTSSATPSGENMASKVILENVQVLAAGQSMKHDEEGKPQDVQVITLLVSPEDAQKVALAAREGHIQLALRNPLDLAHANPAPVERSRLFGQPSSGPASLTPLTPAGVSPLSPRAIVVPTARTVIKPASPAVEPPPPVAEPKHSVELIQGDKRETFTFSRKPKRN